MMQAALAAFILGVILARAGAWTAWGIGFELLGGETLSQAPRGVWREDVRWALLWGLGAALLLSKAFLKGSWPGRLVAGMAGLFWGLIHAAPPPGGVLLSQDARILAASTPSEAVGPVLMDVGGRVVEGFAPQRPGSLGRVRADPAPRLFSARRVRFQVFFRPAAGPEMQRSWPELVRGVRDALSGQLDGLSRFHRHWLAGLVLGERVVMPPGIRRVFLQTGLYHLLVVSGLHVSLVAWLLGAALRTPLQLAYALRLIPPPIWRQAAAAMRVLAALAALLYLAVTGSSAAAQRSALLFVVWQLCVVFCGALPLGRRLLIAALAQAALYPIGFVSEATFMSWSAYLVVLRGPSRMAGGWAELRYLLGLQLKLLILVAAAFGQLALVGILANLVLVPLFSLILGSGLLIMLGGPGFAGRPVLLALHDSFIELVSLFGGLCDRMPWLSWSGPDLPGLLREGCVVASGAIVLSSLRRWSIRPTGGSSNGG